MEYLATVSEIEQNGNDFKITMTTGSKVLVNQFTIGKEAELETITGNKIKVRENHKVWQPAVGSSCVSSLANLQPCFMFEDGVSS